MISQNILKGLKNQPITVEVYNRLLRWRCRHVKRYLFVASTGRSGTQTLCDILGAVPGAVAFHEPRPVFNPSGLGRYGDDIQFFFRHRKAAAIRRAAERAEWYVETNHNFIKGFSELAAEEFGPRLGVINLVRKPVEVAMSYYALGTIPGLTEKASNWLLDINDPGNVISMGKELEHDGRFPHPFYRCLWYWYEIQARFARFTTRHDSVPATTIRTRELNDPATLAQRLGELGLSVDARHLERVRGVHTNTKSDEKRAHGETLERREALAMQESLEKFLLERNGRVWVEPPGL